MFFSRLPGCGGEWRAALFLFPSPPHHRPYISLPNLHQEEERKKKGEGIFIQSFAEGKADFAVGERKGEGGLAEKAARFKSAQGKGSLLRPRGEREREGGIERKEVGLARGEEEGGKERGFFNYWMLPPLLPLPLSDRRRERGERKREGARLSGGGRGSSWGREVAFPSSSSALIYSPTSLYSPMGGFWMAAAEEEEEDLFGGGGRIRAVLTVRVESSGGAILRRTSKIAQTVVVLKSATF